MSKLHQWITEECLRLELALNELHNSIDVDPLDADVEELEALAEAAGSVESAANALVGYLRRLERGEE